MPPILIIIAFKIYINRTYHPAFYFFNPSDEEIRQAKVHSERADAQGNRLEKRFGHPALHAELFTPMLHAKMMPLLSQVYQGKINRDHAKLDEYGGQRMDAQIVPGGIKIAAIDQVCRRAPFYYPTFCQLILFNRMTLNTTLLYINVTEESWIGTRDLLLRQPCLIHHQHSTHPSHNITQTEAPQN